MIYSVRLSSSEVPFKLHLHFFGWSHVIVHGSAKAQKHVNSIREKFFAFKKNILLHNF